MAVRRDLEELLSLSVLPLVDARDELKEISDNSEGSISLSEETDTQSIVASQLKKWRKSNPLINFKI